MLLDYVVRSRSQVLKISPRHLYRTAKMVPVPTQINRGHPGQRPATPVQPSHSGRSIFLEMFQMPGLSGGTVYDFLQFRRYCWLDFARRNGIFKGRSSLSIS